MSNYEEEQAMEIEALTSIFEEGKEFESVSSTEFKLMLVPHSQGEGENHVGFTLHITYTAEYPETAPEWEVEDAKGLPDPKLKALKALIEENIESSLGMAMIYTVAEACQEFLKENNTKELSMHEEMLLRTKAEGGGDDETEEGEEDDDEDYDNFAPGQEEEEWKGLAEKAVCPEADRITPDTFTAWKLKFDEEMIAAGVIKLQEKKGPTGKQIFMEAGGKDAEAAKKADDGQAKEEDGGAIVYNAELFGEVDDDDLEDLSDGED